MCDKSTQISSSPSFETPYKSYPCADGLICKPLKSREEIAEFLRDPPAWRSLCVELKPHSDYAVKNMDIVRQNHPDESYEIQLERPEAFCHTNSDLEDVGRHLRKGLPKTLVCHDMANGYHDDSKVDGTGNYDGYTFCNWAVVDIFCYFSHHFITIPPLGWINVGHAHGVKVIGTVITEWSEGVTIWDSILETSDEWQNFASELVTIAKTLKFDGWLLNVENKISKPETLLQFVKYLHELMHREMTEPVLIWYDSVTVDGVLFWQNGLNAKNKAFFDACDGIFTNYSWREEDVRASAGAAGTRLRDVFVGIDVWGRNFHGGGQFNTQQAVKVAYKHGCSLAIFAPAWTHEAMTAKDMQISAVGHLDDIRTFTKFLLRERALWGSIWPYLNTKLLKELPFQTSFCKGQGRKRRLYGEVLSPGAWFNLRHQQYQLHAAHGPHAYALATAQTLRSVSSRGVLKDQRGLLHVRESLFTQTESADMELVPVEVRAKAVKAPPAQNTSLVAPPAHHTSVEAPPAHHTSAEAPPAHHSSVETSPAHHSSVEAPLAHHSSVEAPPAHISVEAPPAHHSSVEAPPAHHSSVEAPPAHHTSVETPPAHHTSVEAPPAHHTSVEAPPAHHSSVEAPPAHHTSVEAPPAHHSSVEAPPAHHASVEAPPAHHSSVEAPPAHHTSVETPPAHHTSVEAPPAHHTTVEAPPEQRNSVVVLQENYTLVVAPPNHRTSVMASPEHHTSVSTSPEHQSSDETISSLERKRTLKEKFKDIFRKKVRKKDSDSESSEHSSLDIKPSNSKDGHSNLSIVPSSPSVVRDSGKSMVSVPVRLCLRGDKDKKRYGLVLIAEESECLEVHRRDAFNGGSCISINPSDELNSEPRFIRLFYCDITVENTLVACVVTKIVPGHDDQFLNVVLNVKNQKGVELRVDLIGRDLPGQGEAEVTGSCFVPPLSSSDPAFKSLQRYLLLHEPGFYVSIENPYGWKVRYYEAHMPGYRVTSVNCRTGLKEGPILLGYFGMCHKRKTTD